MAINLQTQISLNGRRHHHGDLEPLAILYSNRSAANASLNLWSDALDDAEACISLAPKWIKVRCTADCIYNLNNNLHNMSCSSTLRHKVWMNYKVNVSSSPCCTRKFTICVTCRDTAEQLQHLGHKDEETK